MGDDLIKEQPKAPLPFKRPMVERIPNNVEANTIHLEKFIKLKKLVDCLEPLG